MGLAMAAKTMGAMAGGTITQERAGHNGKDAADLCERQHDHVSYCAGDRVRRTVGIVPNRLVA
jgi:hypothetical protein